MKQEAIGKAFRAVLIAAILVVALVGDAWDKGRCATAQSCDEAFMAYLNATNSYEIARVSYFYGQPITCTQECQRSQNVPQCIYDCELRRHTELAEAEINLFSMASATCTPYTLDECDQARQMHDNCLAQYNPNNYSDPDEAAAVASQYWACREASKIDTCL